METKQAPFNPQMLLPLDLRVYKATEAEILTIPVAARWIGMEIYAYSEDQWWQFQGGTADVDLVLSDRGGAKEVIQAVTFNEAGKTNPIVLNAKTNVLEITLAADLTSNAKPSGWTGWQKGREYAIFFIKKGNYGFDGSDCVTANNIGYDADIDPFDLLLYIDNTKQRTKIGATGFPGYGQFGRMIQTGSNYIEP